MKSNFDNYRNNFMDKVRESVSFSGQDAEYFMMVKAHYLLATIQEHFGDAKQLKILDVGCGIGRTDQYLVGNFQEVHGLDLSETMLEVAKKTNPSVIYTSYNGITFPYDNEKFDLAFAICVFHHVLPGERDQLVCQMKRVVKPGGLLIVFEHNPFNPFTQLAVNRCEFDNDAVLLSAKTTKRLFLSNGLTVLKGRHILLTPYARWLSVERFFFSLPFGAQYFIVATKE